MSRVSPQIFADAVCPRRARPVVGFSGLVVGFAPFHLPRDERDARRQIEGPAGSVRRGLGGRIEWEKVLFKGLTCVWSPNASLVPGTNNRPLRGMCTQSLYCD
eukprot:317525-Prorocentrum_minimum.AAC.1